VCFLKRPRFRVDDAALPGKLELRRPQRDILRRIYGRRRLDELVLDHGSAARAEQLEIVGLSPTRRGDDAMSARRVDLERSRPSIRSLVRARVTTVASAAHHDPDGALA
jgi:hypothetical protein